MSDSFFAWLYGFSFFAAVFGGVAILAHLYGLPDAPELAEVTSAIALIGIVLIPVSYDG